MAFRLEKWYLDCASPAGDVLIGYSALARGMAGRIGYGATLVGRDDGPLRQRQSLSRGRIVQDGTSLLWENDALGVRGGWAGGVPIGPLVLFESSEGAIEWSCLSANSRVDVRCGDRTMQGLGYAEKISMSVPPWRLPFRQLRWGRYISEDGRDHVVWIAMCGGLTRNWIWVNGERRQHATVGDAAVLMEDGLLNFDSSRELRCGDVAGSILGRQPLVRAVLPRGLRGIVENKRLSWCTLNCGGRTSRGLSVNESVEWK